MDVTNAKAYAEAIESLTATVEAAAQDLLDEIAEYRAAVDIIKREKTAKNGKKQEKTAQKNIARGIF